MSKKVLMLASNYGLWAEELQAPWDALRKAGFDVTLATRTGKTPLPHMLSMDPNMIDPVQNYNVNPKEVVDRVIEILKTGEWDHPKTLDEVKMDDYDALVVIGGPGSVLDLVGNHRVHNLLLKAYKSGKWIGAICYAVGSLVWARDPDNGDRSIIYGRRVTAHPREWDFTFDIGYPLFGATEDNKGTDIVTPGFAFPLKPVIDDAVGLYGEVFADPTSNRQKPQVVVDKPFITALSVESSIEFGRKLVEKLSNPQPGAGTARKGNTVKSVSTVDLLRHEGVTIHSYQSPADGDMVRSQIIETANKLVIIDVQVLRPYAQDLRKYVDRLGKPIERVIVTHGHPDHWAGLEYFTDVPIYALPETQYELANFGDAILGFRRMTQGNLIADQKVVPTNLIAEGEEVIDGLKYRFTKVFDAEAPVMLLVELPDLKTLIAQDLVYNRVYMMVGEKNMKGEYLFDGWIRAVQGLMGKDYEWVLPGHGEPTDKSVLREVIEYVQYAKGLFEGGVGEVALKQKLMEKYPNYRVPEMLDISNVFLYHRNW